MHDAQLPERLLDAGAVLFLVQVERIVQGPVEHTFQPVGVEVGAFGGASLVPASVRLDWKIPAAERGRKSS